MSANLLLDSMRNLWDGLVSRLPAIVTGLLAFLAFYLIGRITQFLLRRSLKKVKVSEHASRLISRIVFIAILGIGVMVALGVMGINAGALVASLGLLSVGIGFALKDVIENFIAGIIIIVQRPFVVGDVILIGQIEGTVRDVRVRDTIIRMYDGRQVFVPNSDIFSGPVINNNHNRLRRLEFTVGVSYAANTASAMREAAEALQAIDGILGEPAVMVVLEDLGESSVDFKVYFWIDPLETGFLEVKSAAIAAVKERLEKAGIEIPFPIVTVQPGASPDLRAE